MNHLPQYLTNLPLFLLFVVAGTLHAAAADPKFPEQELIATLQSEDTPKGEKALACKKLAVVGTGQSVPALAPLLVDPELTSWARIAIEVINDPSADQALLEAAAKADGLTLVGILNSIGVRRHAEALDLLAKQFEGEDEAAKVAAARSLGKIATPEALKTLQAVVKGDGKNSPSVISAAAEGMILIAESHFAGGKSNSAQEIYDQLAANGELPLPRRVEATRGAILSRGEDGIELLVEKLRHENRRIRYVALTAARELQGESVMKKLIAAMSDVPDDQKALYLIALGDRGDRQLVPTLVQTIQKGDAGTDVTVAAINVLAQLGDASALDALLAAANNKDNRVIADAANQTLAVMGAAEVDKAIQSRAATADGEALIGLLQLIGTRRIDADETLTKAIQSEDSSIRQAGLVALGQTASLDQIPMLIERAITSESSSAEAQAETMQALRAACVRMPDQAACVAKLETAMQSATEEQNTQILETLAAMGSPEALIPIAEAATNGSPELQNAATRVLGNWMSVDAAEVLETVASQPNHPYRIRALRGYLRLLRQFLMPAKQRNEMAAKAWELADRKDEKLLVLDAAGRYPSGAMLNLMVKASQDAEIGPDAAQTGLAIARKLKNPAQAAKIASRLQLPAMKIEIVSAKLNGGKQSVDVTEAIKGKTQKSPVLVIDTSNFKNALGEDPAPGAKKTLQIDYKIDGESASASFNEGETVVLPIP